jgi:endoglucanase
MHQSLAQNAVPPVLQESWNAYVQRFVQRDGRVIDHKAAGISTSEGQAYAMLRAVWLGDRSTFDVTNTWAKNNLNSGIRHDSLWAWKWGKDKNGEWHVLDPAFATDADQDAAFALILASKIWKDSHYAEQARSIMRDLHALAVVHAGGRSFLLAGERLCKGDNCRINPSYYAPYAYRVFDQIDKSGHWMDLVDSSYDLLNETSRFSETRLPADWVQLNRETGGVTDSTDNDGAFSYDAFRVYWRIALDRDLFHDQRADKYISETSHWLSQHWDKNHRLPAVIAKNGQPLADYESLEMLSGLMPALRNEAMYTKVQSTYSQGIWADQSSYYIQNWAWFGTALYSNFLGTLELVKRN